MKLLSFIVLTTKFKPDLKAAADPDYVQETCCNSSLQLVINNGQ